MDKETISQLVEMFFEALEEVVGDKNKLLKVAIGILKTFVPKLIPIIFKKAKSRGLAPAGFSAKASKR